MRRVLLVLCWLLRLLIRGLLWGIGLALLLFFLQRSTYPVNLQWNAVAILVRDRQFDYLQWEANALAVKVQQTLYSPHPFMDEAARTAYVRGYMARLAEVQRLESQIAAAYASSANADEVTTDARAQRNRMRTELRTEQPLMESIIEGQVAAVLVSEGFGVLGQLIPPIAAHFTEVPLLLIVSPRDQIRFDISINLTALTIEEQEALETQIDQAQDVSSLIVPLGGIALYPTMILETSSIPYAVEIIAHEWLHNYLYAFPLGYTYDFAGESRIINETTASYFGRVLGRTVLKRYYPDLAELLPPLARPQPYVPAEPGEIPVFDFGALMNETRVTVDNLLAQGKIEQAETYMETQRQVFVTNGYLIRKLNQAYFAFYGGYQSPGGGAGGEDPIGSAVYDLYASSHSTLEWIRTMRDIITREGLLEIRDSAVQEVGGSSG